MSSLLLSTEFWFGAAVLGAYHFAKFSELSSLDPDVAARSAQIPNLRAIDFAGKLAYCSALAAFLAVTFLTYLVLCSISPTILLGWAQVSGAKLDTDLTKFIDSVHYPLYIAAAFIGFTQPGIPVLSQIGNAQRNAFHAWMGVPTRVMNTSGWFSNQIFTRSPGAKQLAKEIQMLLSDGWIQRIDTLYAVTNQRINIRKGILSRSDHSTSYERLQNVTTYQSFLERILGVGLVDFDTAAGDDFEFKFTGIDAPAELAKQVAELQRAANAAHSAGGHGGHQGL